ncbi:glucose-6-phosphatase 3 [Boleophthalmus pectinirostris]|uniref:glucose-6-phosphatase 3 n=1 Tax=Boleophthalmus pectinirostris TaxID=150288 RepID=UPI000A1C62C2|nr:glucose-6-phosphatase 3 [Boleophthalmus pectinirostris]
MDIIHRNGIWMAETLQQGTKSYENFWLVLSHLGDPKAAFLLVFPFTYFISKRVGIAVVWVAAISEWLNVVFKWMLFGERPFWWIGENELITKVHQFPSTCETGPGSPSGHAMITAAVWWVVITAVSKFIYAKTNSVVLTSVPYLLYAALLVVVGLSRIYILAHFPHQVFAGAFTGVILGVVLGKTIPEGRPLLFFFKMSFGLLISAVLINLALQEIGINLSWSIALAKKWCSRPEWIRLDTAPFSSITRDCGALLGLGLAQSWRPAGFSMPLAPRALSLAFSSMGLYHVHRLPLPVKPQLLFYSLFFVKFVIVPPLVMVLVPGAVHFFTNKRKRD